MRPIRGFGFTDLILAIVICLVLLGGVPWFATKHVEFTKRAGASMRTNDANGIYFSAAPTSGQAPLGVQFYATIGHQYAIDFGDGDSGSLRSPCSGAGDAPGAACPPPGVYHTYRSAGSYRAVLRLPKTCPPDVSCDPPPSVGSVTITVTDGTAAPLGHRPDLR